MKFVFVSYVSSMGFSDPQAWLKRINAYTGILEALAVTDTVISIEQIDYEGELSKNGVHYHFMRLPDLDRLLPVKLHWFIKSQQPDVVVVQSFHFPLQVMQLRLMLSHKTRIMIQNHAEQPFKGVKKYLQRIADNFVDAYLFASKTLGHGWVDAGNLASAGKIHEVMEVSSVFKPINRSAAQSKTGVSGQPVFLWVGRLNANKDPLTVVKAFLKYAAINPSARLYMIYHTDELLADIQAVLKGHPYQKHIKLTGKIPHGELLYWFNSADFIVSGSHYEGSGAAVCEAMSCGCIPVVTNIDSFRMMTDNGKCGLLYAPGNEAALLTALQQTQQMDIPQKRKYTLAYYTSTLSFSAIAGRFREIAIGLSR